MLAHLLIRHPPAYRRDAFEAGLKECGFQIAGEPRSGPIGRDDLLVIWNRYGRNHETARRFEAAGARVIVAENGPLGREWRGEHWYSLCLNNPAGGGGWPDLGPARWDSLGVNLCEWRKAGREIIVLAQRGIGPPGIRQPDGWHLTTASLLKRYGPVRIREHPGERAPASELLEDLGDALCCVTWASGAGLKAIMHGVPVVYGYERWIGARAATHISTAMASGGFQLHRPDRAPMFQRLAWSMWRTHEIETGRPFKALLGLPSTG